MSKPTDSPGDFIVRPMTAAEVEMAIDWAASEGWNPGIHDAQSFRSADPDGFFVGLLRGEPVGCISAVAFDEHFGFIGLYIVKPEFRGQGWGLRIWRHGMAHLANRNVGLDGVVAQQANYRKSGFRLAYRNIRFQGVVRGKGCADVSDASDLPFERLLDYDRRHVPAQRPAFLAQWIGQPDAAALAVVNGTRVSGYGVLRRCRTGCKVGPLFADSAQIADDLLGALAARFPGQLITLDAPEANPAAVALAGRHGMTRVFETARMYTKNTPAIPLEHVFGVTSLELG